MQNKYSRCFHVSLLLLGAVLFAGRTTLVCAQEYGDVKFTRKAEGMDDFLPATFPHWIHQMQFKCKACHDDLFKMKVGANSVTMDEINKGKWCGICHNGKDAFGTTFDNCSRCHK